MSQRLPLRAQLGFSALWLCSQRTVAISLPPCPRNAAGSGRKSPSTTRAPLLGLIYTHDPLAFLLLKLQFTRFVF